MSREDDIPGGIGMPIIVPVPDIVIFLNHNRADVGFLNNDDFTRWWFGLSVGAIILNDAPRTTGQSGKDAGQSWFGNRGDERVYHRVLNFSVLWLATCLINFRFRGFPKAAG
jgi:hypothetical protein